ncbi:MAG TPA: hypothetical protein VHM26_08340 [Chitinophagaceae bacterium]|jgi:hypothetical protein|nr:hypothetical protein [Chitinophagaceae bacterium]
MSKPVLFSLAITTFLTGLYAGVGFFTIMGGNPAIARLSDRGFAEFWQHVDHFMAARMPIAGPFFLLSTLISMIILFRITGPSFSSWMMSGALVVLIADLVFTLNVNHPLNTLIQSWDLSNLPANVSEIKMKVYEAFNIRLWFMIISFALVIFSVWSFISKGKTV